MHHEVILDSNCDQGEIREIRYEDDEVTDCEMMLWLTRMELTRVNGC